MASKYFNYIYFAYKTATAGTYRIGGILNNNGTTITDDVDDSTAGHPDSGTQLGDVSGDNYHVVTNNPASTNEAQFVASDGQRFIGNYKNKFYLYTNSKDANSRISGFSTNTREMLCYAAGTAIRVVRGGATVDVAVEDLVIGDLAVTASGARRPIRWLGHRSLDCTDYPRPHEVMPVRITKDAMGENKPSRDLYVSPGHAICVDLCGEVLIPACSLVNGSTIQQVEVDEITYWHVELDSHDILMANGLAAESYIDMGNRGFFVEADVVDLHAGPDAPTLDRGTVTHDDFCRPFHDKGDLVGFARKRLVARAKALGWSLAKAPLGALHLMVDGVRVEPEIRGLSARFLVPAGAETVWLQSETVVPAQIGLSEDVRTLGVLVDGLAIDDGFTASRRIAMDDPRLRLGFHAVEPGPRAWTAGRARLPRELWEGIAGAFFLRVDLGMAGLPHWVAPVTEGVERLQVVA